MSGGLKIGIFDSGVGGRAFIEPVQERFPQAHILYKDDSANLPYGNKTPLQLFDLALPIFNAFVAEGCDVILVACNTLTTNAIELLRREIKVPLVGVEPMVKTAAVETRTNTFVMCATPGTLQSARYAQLKQEFASDCLVIEPDCSNWAMYIENNRQDELALRQLVDDAVQYGADTLVLGCTHYHWIRKELQDIAGDRLKVLYPTKPVIDQLARVIEGLGQLQ